MREGQQLFVDGAWIEPASPERAPVVSPTTGKTVAEVTVASTAEIDAAVAGARRSFDERVWSETPVEDRAAALRTFATLITAQAEELAETIITEMGAPAKIAQVAHVESAAAIFEYYADVLLAHRFSDERESPMGTTRVVKEPVGVVAAIAPWNSPLVLAAQKLAPALAAGCSVVLKPAIETPLDSYVLADAAEAAGLPAGVLSVVPGSREAGEHLVAHRDVDKVSFTGSTRAGRRVGEICGQQVKRVVLELGGKSAAVVLDDAPVESIAPLLVAFAVMNNGQACTAQTRVLAPRARYDEVVDAIAGAIGQLQVGDPFDPATDIGPVATEAQRERIEGYIRQGIDDGARLVVGGGRPASQPDGWFVEPTLLADVDNRSVVAQEEIFGPVMVVIPHDGDEHAIELANDSTYGLAGTVWTGDTDRALAVAQRVRTGTFCINSYFLDMVAPFGGYKQSGLGRAFGPEGLDSYLELKAIGLSSAW